MFTKLQAKHADLPWDVIFSTELFDTFKPNPKAYQGAIRHLSLPPEKCAMVAAHILDLRAAAGQGMKTVYVNRPEEEWDPTDTVKSKKDGGEVDLVVSSFVELASILGAK
jgi:FMN phosphatase YigB (HAD superfamily)